MSKLKVAAFSISIDGYGAGTNQSINNPMGDGGMELHKWVLSTKTFISSHGGEGGEEGINNDFAARSFDNIGAWILGRNMFGPVRGPWPNGDWRGWWGDNPPYHCPVFVLTNYPREPLIMEGGTTFYFVTEGIHKAYELAIKAAGGKDVRLGGGPATIKQFLKAGYIDELHLAIAPVLLGKGESLFDGIDLTSLGYSIAEKTFSENAMHIILKK